MVFVKNMFLFLAKSASKMCLTIIILEREKEFLDSKIRKLNKLKIWYFSKGVSPWFLSKICFYFWQNQPAKCV